MTRYPAGKISKHGVDVPIEVDDYGRWYATVGEKSAWADTRAALESKIGKLLKSATVKVNIPFTALAKNSLNQTIGTWRGVAIGLHSSNGNVLVRRESGQAEQYGSIGHSYATMGDLTPDEATEWATLQAAQERANKALRSFENVHSIHLSTVVQEAIDKAAEAADKAASDGSE